MQAPTMLRRAMVALGVLTSCGCMTRYRQANELAQEGRYVEAAELFEQLAREKPNDAELPKLMQRARYRAVEHALGRARQYRLASDAKVSQRHFAEGLGLRKRWSLKLDGALEGTIEDEREDATARLNAQVLPLARKGEALAAEAVLREHQFLLQHDELSALRVDLTGAARASGELTCKELRPSAQEKEPYWTSLVAHYCKHFQAPPPTEPPLPDTFSTLQASFAVTALGEGLAGALAGALEGRARRGPWFSDRGPLQATLTTRGSAPTSHREHPVRLSAEWTERVPYVEHVKRKLQTKVTVMECEAYDEQTPTGPVTRTRQVERERIQVREEVVAETRYREVPRAFEYPALRVERTTQFTARTELAVAGQLAGTGGGEATQALHGHHHDVTFQPAKVRPSRPAFPTVEAWQAERAAQLEEAFAEGMREGWRARFCRGRVYSPEEAARCLRVGRKVPPEAVGALEPRLGADAAHTPELFGGEPR